MHDARNAADPRYAPYAFAERDPKAIGAIAAVQARTLGVVPLSKDGADLDLMLAQDLAVPLRGAEATVGERSRALGRRAAAAVLAKRSGDGWDTAGNHVFREPPGAYRTTSPWQGFVLQPGFRSRLPVRAADRLRGASRAAAATGARTPPRSRKCLAATAPSTVATAPPNKPPTRCGGWSSPRPRSTVSPAPWCSNGRPIPGPRRDSSRS